MFADLSCQLEHVSKRSSTLHGPLAGALDHWSVGNRIAERNAKFNDAGPGVDRLKDDLFCSRDVGVATGDVGDERGFGFEVEGHEGSIVDGRSQIAEGEAPPTPTSTSPAKSQYLYLHARRCSRAQPPTSSSAARA